MLPTVSGKAETTGNLSVSAAVFASDLGPDSCGARRGGESSFTADELGCRLPVLERCPSVRLSTVTVAFRCSVSRTVRKLDWLGACSQNSLKRIRNCVSVCN